jgi:hypothetical protein
VEVGEGISVGVAVAKAAVERGLRLGVALGAKDDEAHAGRSGNSINGRVRWAILFIE